MSHRFVYMTAGSREEAHRIGKALVEARLAACANILDGMQSIYWWEGEVQDDRETVLIAKSREELLPALIDKVRDLHSYDCPCVVALPILEGHEDYLNWIVSETSASPG